MLYPVELRAPAALNRRIADYRRLDRDGRGRGIRTPDILLPKQARYQTALYPAVPSGDSRCAPTPQQVGIVWNAFAHVNARVVKPPRPRCILGTDSSIHSGDHQCAAATRHSKNPPSSISAAARSFRRDGEAMTLTGTVNKTGDPAAADRDHRGLCLEPDQFTPTARVGAGPTCWGGAIGGLIVALVTVFKKAWAPVTAPLYALFEGLFLGGISAMFEARCPGIVIQAVDAHLRHAVRAAGGLSDRASSRRPRTSSSAWSPPPAASACSTWSRFVLGFFGTRSRCIHESGTVGIVLQPVRRRDRRAQPGARLRLHRDAASSTARRSTWSGTARSACWSRWCGCTSRSCACWPKLQSRD